MFRFVVAGALCIVCASGGAAAPVASTPAPSAPAVAPAPAVTNGIAADKPIASSQLVPGSDSVLNATTIGEQYGGLVTDQTVTVAGRDFYQYFVSFWRDKPLNERFELTILERPSARWGNQVAIEYQRRRVFATTLPPSRSYIKAISEQAVEIAYTNVVNAETQRLLFRDQDLGLDEM